MEKEYDGELNEYQVISEPKMEYLKQLYWDLAIGLQKVDGLSPSKYMEGLVNKSVNGEIDNDTLERMLQKYYEAQDLDRIEIQNEKECDSVSVRIVELLEMNVFELSVEFIKYIHSYLFKDIYEFNGNFRKVNITNLNLY